MIAEVGLDRCAAPTNARIELANRPGRNARLVESMVTSTRPERDGEAAAKCCTLDTRTTPNVAAISVATVQWGAGFDKHNARPN